VDERNVAEVAEHSISMRKLMERFPDALTVRDATEDKTLLIEERDVKAGKRKDPSACAAVQCAKRAGFGGMIGRRFAFLVKGSEVTRYHLGEDARVRTAIFDDRGTMTTGPLILSAPSRSQRMVNMARRLKIHRTIKAQQRRTNNKKTRDKKNAREDYRRHIVTHGFRSWDKVGSRG
jgi:hypothetical protein